MAVSEVIARLYDSGMQKLEKKAEVVESEFSQVFNEVEKSDANQCEICAHAAETAESGETKEIAAEVGSQEVVSAAGFRFSMFIRTSSSIQSYGNDLMNKFVDATRNFTRALYQQNTEKVAGLDAYLGQAQQAAASGQRQTMDFVDQMLEAADNGLKMATNSVNAAGMMSGFNLSMNSAMPGTSGADIAGVYLQDALKNGLPTSSATRTSNSSGLQIVSQQYDYAQKTELKKVGSAQDQSEVQILDKFLELLDKMTTKLEKPASTISEFGFKFAFSNLFEANQSGSEHEQPTSEKVQDEEQIANKNSETLKA